MRLSGVASGIGDDADAAAAAATVAAAAVDALLGGKEDALLLVELSTGDSALEPSRSQLAAEATSPPPINDDDAKGLWRVMRGAQFNGVMTVL